MLRTEAGRDPYDKDLAGLVGELSTRSDEFRVRWGAQDVQLHRTGVKHIRHPVVGDLHLSYEVMELTADPGLALVAFSAEAGSPADDALRFLASWAATHEPADALATPDQNVVAKRRSYRDGRPAQRHPVCVGQDRELARTARRRYR